MVPTPRAESMPGRGLHTDYHVEPDVIGAGSFARVFKGYHRTEKDQNDNHVIRAIKQTSDETFSMEKLANEADLHGKLDHPNIIKLCGAYAEEGYNYIVMELCTGGDLSAQLAHASCNERRTSRWMTQILNAVAYLHCRDIAYRDMKLENLLKASDADLAEIKLVDFGFAKYCPDKFAEKMHTRLGSPDYIAPQVLAGSYTEKCDVWGCGVVAYLLMCGYPPFYGSTDKELFRCIKKGRFDYPSEEWEHTSLIAKDFVNLSLTRCENERPSAKKLLSHKWISDSNLRVEVPKIWQASRTDIPDKMVSSCRKMSDHGKATTLVQDDLLTVLNELSFHPAAVLRFKPIMSAMIFS